MMTEPCVNFLNTLRVVNGVHDNDNTNDNDIGLYSLGDDRKISRQSHQLYKPWIRLTSGLLLRPENSHWQCLDSQVHGDEREYQGSSNVGNVVFKF